MTDEQVLAMQVVMRAARRARPPYCRCDECTKLDLALDTLQREILDRARLPELPESHTSCRVTLTDGSETTAYHNGFTWCSPIGSVVPGVVSWRYSRIRER